MGEKRTVFLKAPSRRTGLPRNKSLAIAGIFSMTVFIWKTYVFKITGIDNFLSRKKRLRRFGAQAPARFCCGTRCRKTAKRQKRVYLLNTLQFNHPPLPAMGIRLLRYAGRKGAPFHSYMSPQLFDLIFFFCLFSTGEVRA